MKSLQFQGREGSGLIGHPQHGFGYLPDPSGHRYKGFYMHPAAKASIVNLPKETNNRLYLPPRWSQGQTGSCTGHGMAGAITTTFAAHERPLPMPVSPRVSYALGRAVDRTNPAIPLVDQGAQPNSLVRAYGLWGCVLEAETDGGINATSDEYTAFLEAHVNDDPKLGELEVASQRLLVGFNAIEDGAFNKLLQFQQALAGKYMVGVAVDAGSEAFQDFQGAGVLDYTGSDPDHWVFICDYRKLANGSLEFLLVNSWGLKNWTPDGTAWVTQNFVNSGCFNSLVVNLGQV